MLKLHIGLDDVDSPAGGCTTHLAVKIAHALLEKGIRFIDYPNLVRLNPAVPWKTRGNGAVAIRIEVSDEGVIEDIVGLTLVETDEYLREYSNPKHQPAIVFVIGDIPDYLEKYSGKALYDFIPTDYAMRVMSKLGEKARSYTFKGKRGLIGSLAAVGYQMLSGDYTYELLAYRTREYLGKPRLIDEESIVEMDKATSGRTILNYDYEARRPLIVPKGPDPVLYGIRGEYPWDVLEASRYLRVYEPIEYMAIFRTNQHTDSHLHPLETICDAHPYMCIRINGVVASKPRRIQGGHVIFKVCNECCIDVAAYEPTKDFRKIVEKLEPGDKVEVVGCVRPGSSSHGITLNLEKIRVAELSRKVIYQNPICPVCGRRMESAGRNKGFKCRYCGFRSRDLRKLEVVIPRDLEPGWYQPPLHAFKHLMRPLERPPRHKVFTLSELVTPFIWRPPSSD